MSFRNGAIGIGLTLVLAYALGSGYWVSSGDTWYQSLHAPSWQPPNWVFGVIWPYNFIALGIAVFIVGAKATHKLSIVWLASLAISITLALAWSYYFYVPHRLSLAAIFLVLAALFTLPVLIIAWRSSWKLGLALLPYQLWVAIASTLALGYSRFN
ncbi:MAG: TspO/MBR family protein [Actinomycetes bacterium]